MQRKFQEIQDPIEQVSRQFIKKHMRFSTLQEQRLELQFGSQWTSNIVHTQQEVPNQPKILQFRQNTQDMSGFYNLVMLLFPQTASVSPLDIHILDTMFFLPDHSICYVYRDIRRGLSKLKQKGLYICDAFIRRKNRKKDPFGKTFTKTKSTITVTDQKTEKGERGQKGNYANLDYFVLLRYKDNSFLRLKQPDLRSIFTNPLYANQRFRHNNCTQYIQALPQQDAMEIRVQYHWIQFKDDVLMRAAIQGQLGRVTELGQKEQLKQALKQHNTTVYIYFLTFEIAAYLAMHYNKRLESAHFHFVCEQQQWTLAGADSIFISPLPRKQYVKAELWDANRVHFDLKDQAVSRTPIFQQKPEPRSLLYQTIESHFDKTHQNLRKDVGDFVKKQINRVRKVEDQKVSKAIFDILHPGEGQHFYQCLNCPQRLQKTLNCRPATATRQRPSLKPKPSKKPPSSLLQQIIGRQSNKQQFIYRGLYH